MRGYVAGGRGQVGDARGRAASEAWREWTCITAPRKPAASACGWTPQRLAPRRLVALTSSNEISPEPSSSASATSALTSAGDISSFISITIFVSSETSTEPLQSLSNWSKSGRKAFSSLSLSPPFFVVFRLLRKEGEGEGGRFGHIVGVVVRMFIPQRQRQCTLERCDSRQRQRQCTLERCDSRRPVLVRVGARCASAQSLRKT